MLAKFKREFSHLLDDYKDNRYLVAASGGLDSTVLIHLCNSLHLDFAICHCNFQLRGEESDGDQSFLEELANTLNRPIYVHTKNTKTYAEEKKLSIQEAAREIRYEWFEQCLNEYKYDYLLTAHHANDNIETYVINSFRGTGIKGLTGIPQKRDKIIRPLLNFSREELHNYTKANNILWREDSSNESDNYLRNIIRHHLIPFYTKRQDNLYARFETTLNHINRQESLLEDYLHLIFKQVVESSGEHYRIKIEALKQFQNHDLILIELLREFGFKDDKSLVQLLDAQVGKFLTSTSHKIVKERGFLELFLIENTTRTAINFELNALPLTIEFENGVLEFSEVEDYNNAPSQVGFLNKDKITDKLSLRPVQNGDYFYPLGMTGKRKLSDFLKDEKLTNFAKSKTWVLTHNKDIVWVVNQRIDDRYKITKTTSACLKVEFKPR